MIRQGSRTFYLASMLLPPAMRDPAYALYAFCRLSDDAVDCAGGRHAEIAGLRDRLGRAARGEPLDRPTDRALADVLGRHAIPVALPEALLEGLEWDAEGRRYETIGDLQDYAARVAGTVGAMMAILMGRRSPDVLARACDLGIAMQLTNISRDTGEDARQGRIYLPLDWLREAGIDPDGFLDRPAFCPALASVVQRLLAVADGLYARADAGIAELPLACRPGIHAARLLYAGIGHELERTGLDSVARRTVIPGTAKAVLLARAAALPRRRPDVPVPPPAGGNPYSRAHIRPRSDRPAAAHRLVDGPLRPPGAARAR